MDDDNGVNNDDDGNNNDDNSAVVIIWRTQRLADANRYPPWARWYQLLPSL